MSGHLDSEPVFRVRLSSLGIPDGYINAMIAAGLNSMAKMAYVCSLQPGTADDTPFLDEVARASGLTGHADLSVGHKSAFRRCWFEASTVAIAEIKSRIEATQDDAPRKMPKPERNTRHREQQSRLAGVKIEGHLEPSHSLIDAVWSMREEDQLKYLQLEICTSRPQEALGIKKETFVKAEANTGNLKQVERSINPTADLTTEYRVKLAFTRRALAFDNVGLCDFSVMEDLHDYLYGLVMKEALDTHQAISVQQIIKADRQIWIRLIELTREGINPDATGRKPIEINLPIARLDPMFCALLQPLPRSYSPGPYDKANGNSRGSNDNSAPYSQGAKGTKGKGRGAKGKGRGGKGNTRGGKAPAALPDELKGFRTQTNSGNSYCWKSNMACGCPDAKVGNYCNKGFHGCMKCGSHQHTATSCTK